MRVGMIMDYSGGFRESVELLQDYEAAGLEMVAVGEAYSFDAVSQLGFIAARTDRVQLASGILPLYSRTPALVAMTAAGLDHVSEGRFNLGLGASGPQVIEGFHGIRYDAPLGRTRETVEICRTVWRREPLVHDGRHYHLPLTPEQGGSGLGKPLKLINRPLRDRIPVSLAALGPANVALAAEIAEGWQPLFFHPEHADRAFGTSLAEGRARRDPSLPPLDVQLQVTFSMEGDDERHLAAVRDQLALYIGGMGARDKNFYHQLAGRYGYEREADEIQELFLAGRKDDAAAAVPDELARGVSLIGDETEVAAKVERFAAAGVTTLLLNAVSSTAEQRVGEVARLAALVAHGRST
ncbi:LLM class F420-dependent oxidoreductase [Nocardioides zeae]|uniref:LLM class F420-dependent oxidoreductase n=1 Tax=Nocardioides zeae TaxID=1457234 RepID=A0A6P0HG97_9ACTN|nr:LLM class F420-dependent oxidoreductase [Nocardioides zeae]